MCRMLTSLFVVFTSCWIRISVEISGSNQYPDSGQRKRDRLFLFLWKLWKVQSWKVIKLFFVYFLVRKKYLHVGYLNSDVRNLIEVFHLKSNAACIASISVYCERNFQRGMCQYAIHQRNFLLKDSSDCNIEHIWKPNQKRKLLLYWLVLHWPSQSQQQGFLRHVLKETVRLKS